MRKKILKGALVLAFFTFNLCSFSINAQKRSESYYVRATGNDHNNGKTEKSPFKTI